LPRAFRLASTTIDALFGLDVELIGIFLPVGAGVVVDPVTRTNADASRIETVSAKRHFPFLLTS
jgi:hypothetical protein